jgi:hypothetical protein
MAAYPPGVAWLSGDPGFFLVVEGEVGLGNAKVEISSKPS